MCSCVCLGLYIYQEIMVNMFYRYLDLFNGLHDRSTLLTRLEDQVPGYRLQSKSIYVLSNAVMV